MTSTSSEVFSLKDDIVWAQRMLRNSFIMYTFADFRESCVLGKSKIPFKLLALEDDRMTTSQILNGAPHVHDPFATGSTHGFSMEDFVFTVLRIVSKFGLGDGERYLLGDVAPAMTQVGERMSLDFLTVEETTLKALDGFLRFWHGEDSCARGDRDGSRGILGTAYNYCYIQGFFDRVYEGANTDDDFQSCLDTLQGKIDYQKTGCGDEGTSRAQPCMKVWTSLATANLQNKIPELVGATKIVWSNDRKNNQELVYAILANKTTKSITVIFRGSVLSANKDWVRNLEPRTYLTPNPIQEDYDEKKDTIEVRKGYWKYLLRSRADNGRSKYNEIADKAYEYGKELGEEFSLEVTGHSLGGALASLFGFYASVDPRFNKYNKVKVCTFGSPVAGKVTFAKAFRHQEEVGQLEHARFVMSKDPVPKVRFLDPYYAHTGHRIELSADSTVAPAVSYMDNSSRYGTIGNWASSNFITWLLKNPFSLMTYHGGGAYYDALQNLQKNELTVPARTSGSLLTLPASSMLGGVVFCIIFYLYVGNLTRH